MRPISLALLMVLVSCALAQPPAPRRLTTSEALELYGVLTGKTVLGSSSLPVVDAPMVLPSPETPDYRERAPEAIIEWFQQAGLEFKPMGDKFVVVAPQGATIDLPPPPASTAVEADEGSSRLPKGTIRFPGAALEQVLEIYSELRRCTILRPAGLPAATVSLQTESDLTLEQCLYAIEAVLALNGIAVVDDGERFVQVVPLAMAPQVEAKSPERSPGDELIKPKAIPKFNGFLIRNRPLPGSATSGQLEMESASAERMLEYYATLLQVNAIPSERFRNVPVVFSASRPLTRSEILYAIRTVLRLNGLVIQQEGGNAVRLGHKSAAP